MKCACEGGCLLAGDPRNYLIEVDGNRFHFEMHHWCGPAVLTAGGDIATNQPGPRHPFWTAVTLWGWQGRKVDADGLCVWEKPVEPEYVHIVGRHYAAANSALAKRFGK
ncbi:hypothetical protein [Rhodoferax koreensis]|uniref:hypothetical protein n=1 Tax=Rhodoferax koreensis TaxID=1842727 RepID=UPI0012FF803F|nr:hypothetical protein [Rhodoferax koreense]